MSDVNASDLRLIESRDDIIDTYAPAGKNAKSGIEVELAFFAPENKTGNKTGNNPENNPLNLMSVCQNKVLKNASLDKLPGDWVRNEPTSETLEVNSIAVLAGEEHKVLADINKKLAIVMEQAKGIGLKRSYFQSFPDKTAKELLSSLMPVPRYQAFFGPPRKDMEGIAAYFSICKSNQISVSYPTYAHLLENIRRLYFMAPFMFLLTDNTSGFAEGKPFTGNMAMHYRAALEKRGLVPDYVFTAKSGEEYIEAHINNVMNNPLFVYYNEKGEIIRIPSGEWSSFNNLRERGLNTTTNYYFAETILWPDVKIAALKDSNDEVNGHRYEARMLGVGAWQHQCTYLITTALAFNKDFAAATDALLTRFGFDTRNPENARAPLTNAYNDARTHNGEFFNIPYGNGTMQDFASDFATLLEAAFEGTRHESEITPAIEICRSGCTDGKVNRMLFPTLADINHHQRTYNQDALLDTTTTAYSLYKDRLDSSKTKCCAQNHARA